MHSKITNRISHQATLLLLIGCLFNSPSNAQETNVLKSFEAGLFNETVYLDWTIEAGNLCYGIRILRSTDAVSFDEIGAISGVCGNNSQAESYRFIDSFPVWNATNYYRIELGGLENSAVAKIDLIDLTNGFQVRPNPLVDKGILYFSNALKDEFQLQLFTMDGRLLTQSTTRENFFDIALTEPMQGVLHFVVKKKDHSQKISGSILVVGAN